MSSEHHGSTVGEACWGAEETRRLRELKEQLDLQENLVKIGHKIVVLSGKGGVGKSSVATNLAVALSLQGQKTGLLDVDLHGPSIPTLLGIERQLTPTGGTRIEPAAYNPNLKVMSVGLFLKDQDEAMIWRGPAKHGVIKQLLTAVEWGDLDYLIVDCPPGTGDEPLSVIQLLEGAASAIVVTTPQDVALNDVRKSVTFCRQVKLPVIGVVENMSGFVCPHCGESIDIFKSGGGSNMAGEMNVPFLGRIPLDPALVSAGDKGLPFVEHLTASPTTEAFDKIVATVIAWCNPTAKSA
ncbi:Mrp/NBP35 family ATP-binding protein [Geobacter sp. AOG2]|uniref:Mrp/NBP35 family ATP-binding protein n=1 Tax=Geobacter sp. AOG2 TaxID=1566347 RepID=UPI001CC646EE|nr:Mrp/NBP35 family ATP-binding protein [Geobacter sp. AOG2]GFE60688.1 iron-sulfur cluster carrier protein [Geobacter sp. AOG2]